VQPYLGKTVHIREVNEGAYPYATLAELLVKADYQGWVCLEARTKPADRVVALAEQRRLFMEMVQKARQAVG
ncbi:MAG: sugar phosphate isomerase/epimerase, partial [Verrucomicrobiaceae bacterium]|nr:sugar phosphate isomerase/epimerase [Verrucomicrobiaceae bacterium]